MLFHNSNNRVDCIQDLKKEYRQLVGHVALEGGIAKVVCSSNVKRVCIVTPRNYESRESASIHVIHGNIT